MDIHQLYYFVQVAECGSYSVAAQKLFVSQPALSKAVKRLEEELGFTVFYTYQKKQWLTDAGQVFYEKAIHLLKEYNDLLEITNDRAAINKGHINIGLCSEAGIELFSHIIPPFRKNYPLIDFTIFENSSFILKEKVFRGNIDLAFVDISEEDNDNSTFDLYELTRNDLVIVASNDNPISKFESIHYCDINGIDYIAFNESRQSLRRVDKLLQKEAIKVNTILSSSHWHFIFEMVAANVGFTIAPLLTYKKYANPSIKAIPLEEPEGKGKIALIAKKDVILSRASELFLDYATNTELYKGISE